MTSVNELLDAKRVEHGQFDANAEVSQMIKDYIRSRGTDHLTFIQKEALDFIAAKIARIIQNPYNVDSWDDIAGYAGLAADELRGIKR